MDESDAHAEGRRQNIAVNRQRSHRKTMMRVAQRRKLKESKRMRSVQVFKQLDDKSLSAIVDAMTPRTFPPGETIVEQGALAALGAVCATGADRKAQRGVAGLAHQHAAAGLPPGLPPVPRVSATGSD